MITDLYDTSRPIIKPSDFYKSGNLCDTVIITFSCKIFEKALWNNVSRIENKFFINSAAGARPLVIMNLDGQNVGIYNSDVGACVTTVSLTEIMYITGAKNVIMFGSCGSLNRDILSGDYIVPTEAYRGEGVSYYYAPPSDFIDIKNADKVEKIFQDNGIPYHKGKVFTTDAPYRETRNIIDKMKEMGAIGVEMELSGVQAVCDHYEWELYNFLEAGDNLDGEEYQKEGLHNANHRMDKFEIVKKILAAI